MKTLHFWPHVLRSHNDLKLWKDRGGGALELRPAGAKKLSTRRGAQFYQKAGPT